MNRNILDQIPFCLSGTDFPWLGERYQGKVRDTYLQGDKRILIATDRLSAFDKVVTLVPFKGQVLTELADYWFKKTSSIIDNHVIDHPHPNVVVGHNANVLPVEIVIRGYLAGSGLRDYKAGHPISGVVLPTGIQDFGKLPEPILTPSTKAPNGTHDMPISEAEIVSSNIISKKLLEEIKEKALNLFKFASTELENRGLILVDTKYEMGLIGDKLILVDEIHTLDSSRFWIKESYSHRLSNGQEPEMLDKEPTRQWLISQGFMGEGEIPHFNEENRAGIADRYLRAFNMITNSDCVCKVGDVKDEINQALQCLRT